MRARLAPFACLLLLLGSVVVACGEPMQSGLGGIEVNTRVFGAGTGDGLVTAVTEPAGLNCQIEGGAALPDLPSNCEDFFVDAGGGGQFELMATPSPGNDFLGWEGCSSDVGTCTSCSGGGLCLLSFSDGMDVEFEMRARFQDTPVGVQVFFDDLDGFNTAAGGTQIVIDFDAITPGTDFTDMTSSGVTFALGEEPAPSAPLIVVAGDDTSTPSSSFSGVVDAGTNKLFATSGENVLSPGGESLGPGPDPEVENDDLELTFSPAVTAVGFDILFQSYDVGPSVFLTVIGDDGTVLLPSAGVQAGTGEGGAPGDALSVGIVSISVPIARVLIDETDENAVFPDANIGFDTFRLPG